MEEAKNKEDIEAIYNFLKEDCYKIVTRSDPYRNHYFNALKEYNSCFIDLEINYDYHNRFILLTIICLDEINISKYSFCLELLNHLSTYYPFTNFFLNPENHRLSCAIVIPIVDHPDPLNFLTKTLESVASYCIEKQLLNLIAIFKEDINLPDAVRRTVGDVPEVRSLSDLIVPRSLKDYL